MCRMCVKKAADYLGLSEDSVRALYTKKLIKHRRVGPGRGTIQFEREWLDEYLESTIVEPINASAPRNHRKKKQPAATSTGPVTISIDQLRRELA